jgi:predicted nucleic acid-binding Zn ribbon protein
MSTVKAEGNVVITEGRHEFCGICRSDYESRSKAADQKSNKCSLLKNKQVQKRNMVIFYNTVGALRLLCYLLHQANKSTSLLIVLLHM